MGIAEIEKRASDARDFQRLLRGAPAATTASPPQRSLMENDLKSRAQAPDNVAICLRVVPSLPSSQASIIGESELQATFFHSIGRTHTETTAAAAGGRRPHTGQACFQHVPLLNQAARLAPPAFHVLRTLQAHPVL